MRIGPKYKIARRLKSPIFEKTQTQKYALREERQKRKKLERSKTDYGRQLNEKQKARMFYAVSERQFAKYARGAIAQKSNPPTFSLLRSLESRLDNVVWRAGLLPTHLSARQAVAHGHFLVNDRRVYVPSLSVREGDRITIRAGSQQSKLFQKEDKEETAEIPNWLVYNPKIGELMVKEGNFIEQSDLLFDLGQVIEYYQR